jgi:hypothetical protein
LARDEAIRVSPKKIFEAEQWSMGPLAPAEGTAEPIFDGKP